MIKISKIQSILQLEYAELFRTVYDSHFIHSHDSSVFSVIVYNDPPRLHTIANERERKKIVNNTKPMNYALNEGDGLRNSCENVYFHRLTLFICDNQSRNENLFEHRICYQKYTKLVLQLAFEKDSPWLFGSINF